MGDMAVAVDRPPADTVPVDDNPTPAPLLGILFTGSGREYFRIWVVNLLLTLATAGIYSAWAKVRRLQYFDRNTVLAGARFDFHGNPRAILRGRVLAVLLLAAYHYAFGISVTAGLVTIAVLLASLPYLIRSALRFRLANTSYRGLRFHFAGPARMAYQVYLAPIAVFLLPGVLVAIYGETPWVAAAWLLYLGWPAMYAWMKHYQYGHVWYGDQPSSNVPAVFAFAGIYVRGLLLATSVVIVVFLVGTIAMPLGAVLPADSVAVIAGLAMAATSGLMAYVLLGPYQQVRVMNLCLENTSFPGLRFVSTLSARGYARLQVKNLLLTLLTLGLYRPFAVVSAYRYRLAHLGFAVDEGFDHVVSRVTAGGGAAGDGAADFVGFNLSW